MSNYFTPGVYIEEAPNSVAPLIRGSAEIVGAFMGLTQRGKVGVPYEITSWGAYLDTFAQGMPTPFLDFSELAYAVYGFFQNGGTRCYVMRVAHKGDVVTENNATLATATIVNGPSISAKDEGTWGNSLKVRISENEAVPANFNIYVTHNNVAVESFLNVSNTATDKRYWVSVLSASNYINGSGTLIVTDVEDGGSTVPTYVNMTGGQDGVLAVVDADYVGQSGLINQFDTVDAINLLSIPGVTSDTVIDGILDYCNKRKYLFAVLDCDYAETVESAVTTARSLTGNGLFLFPWIKVAEPASSFAGILHDCPPSGHMQGVMSRIASQRGIWKAPAGTEAFIRGAVDTLLSLTLADTDALNPEGVVAIIPKTGYGIVVWGAKTVGGEYVSHVLLDQHIQKSIFNGTQPFVFEPNVPDTWIRLEATVESFLSTLWQQGGLVGAEAKDAYYVKCDDTNNTDATIRDGYLFCEVGYKRPGIAEFVVFRFSHEIK